MTLKAMYNKIASHYEMANQFGSISKSHAVAIEQIQRVHLGVKAHCKVLDFGVGDGAFIDKMRSNLPNATFTGIDISSAMLEEASKKLPLTAIEASVVDASRYLPQHSQDLVLAHFINAYIPIRTLFQQANLLTRSNGYFSLITTTYESFPMAQKLIAQFINQGTFISTIVGHYYKTMVKNTTVASGQDELKQAFKNYHFQIVDHQRIEIPILIQDVNQLIDFALQGAWFLNAMPLRMMPTPFLRERLKRILNKIFTFPYHDQHIIDVVLAKK